MFSDLKPLGVSDVGIPTSLDGWDDLLSGEGWDG